MDIREKRMQSAKATLNAYRDQKHDNKLSHPLPQSKMVNENLNVSTVSSSSPLTKTSTTNGSSTSKQRLVSPLSSSSQTNIPKLTPKRGSVKTPKPVGTNNVSVIAKSDTSLIQSINNKDKHRPPPSLSLPHGSSSLSFSLTVSGTNPDTLLSSHDKEIVINVVPTPLTEKVLTVTPSFSSSSSSSSFIPATLPSIPFVASSLPSLMSPKNVGGLLSPTITPQIRIMNTNESLSNSARSTTSDISLSLSPEIHHSSSSLSSSSSTDLPVPLPEYTYGNTTTTATTPLSIYPSASSSSSSSRLLGTELFDGMNNLFNSPTVSHLLSSYSSSSSVARTPIPVPDTPVHSLLSSDDNSPFIRSHPPHSNDTHKNHGTLPSLLAPIHSSRSSSSKKHRSSSVLRNSKDAAESVTLLSPRNSASSTMDDESLRTPMNILLKREYSSSSVSFIPSPSASSSFPFHLPVVPSSTAKVPFQDTANDTSSVKESIALSIPEYNPNVTLDQIQYARQQIENTLTIYKQTRSVASTESTTVSSPSSGLVDDIIRHYDQYSSLLANMLVNQTETAEKMKLAQLDIVDKEWKAMNKANDEFAHLLAKETEARTALQSQYDDLLGNFENLLTQSAEVEQEKTELLTKLQNFETAHPQPWNSTGTEAITSLRHETNELRTTIQRLQDANNDLIRKVQAVTSSSNDTSSSLSAPTLDRIQELEHQLLDATTAVDNHRQQHEAMQNRMTELLLTLANRDEQISNLQSILVNHSSSSNEDVPLTYSPHSTMDEHGTASTIKKHSLNDSSVSPKGSSLLMHSLVLSASKFGQSGTRHSFRMFSPSTKDAVETFVLLNQLSHELGTLTNNAPSQPPTTNTPSSHGKEVSASSSLGDSLVLSPSVPVIPVLSPTASTVPSPASTKSLPRIQELTESLRQRIVELTNERDSLRVRCDELTVQTTTLREATAASVCAVMNVHPSVHATGATPLKAPESPEFGMNGGLFSPSSFLSPSSASTARAAREATLAALSSDNRKLNEKVVTLQAIVDSQAREISRIASTLATTKASVLDYERKVEALHTEMMNKENTVETLRNDLRTQSAECTNVTEEMMTAKSTIERLTNEIHRKDTELTNLRTYIENLEDSSYHQMMRNVKVELAVKDNYSHDKPFLANVIAAIPVHSTSECPMLTAHTGTPAVDPNPADSNSAVSAATNTSTIPTPYKQQLRLTNERIEALEREIFRDKRTGTATSSTEDAPSVLQKIVNTNEDTTMEVPNGHGSVLPSETANSIPNAKGSRGHSHSRGRVGLRRVVVRTTGDIEMEYEPDNDADDTTVNDENTKNVNNSQQTNQPHHYDINLSTGTGKPAWSSLSSIEANSQLRAVAATLRGTGSGSGNALNNTVPLPKRQYPSRSVSRTRNANSITNTTTNDRIPYLLHQTEDQLAQDSIDGKPIDETLVQVRERLLYLLNKQTASRSSSVLRTDPSVRTINNTGAAMVPPTTSIVPSSVPSSRLSSMTRDDSPSDHPSLPILNPSNTSSNRVNGTIVSSTVKPTLPFVPSPSVISTVDYGTTVPPHSTFPSVLQKPSRPIRAISNHHSHAFTSPPSVSEVSTTVPVFSTNTITTSLPTVSSPVSSSSLSESIMIFKAIEEEKALRARLANATMIPSANDNENTDEWTDLIATPEH